MTLGVISAIAYGILVALGGLMGYAQARSYASLISGLVSSSLLLIGGWLWSQGSPQGVGLSLGVTVALIIVFIRRGLQTRKAMPAVAMIAAGVLALIGMVGSLL